MSEQRRPNIVLVMTDDQGYGDLGCTGNPVLRTPNLDAFHAGSLRLRDYHVGPTCAPTRAGLLTGRYANSTGVWHTIGGRSLLRQDERTVADCLRDAGWRTGIFGKWHLGDVSPYTPQERGFDEAVVHGAGGISQTNDHWGNDYFDDVYRDNGEMRRFEGYCTDVWFREGLAFIERNRERPFFCMITPNAPHSPWNVETRYSEAYRGQVSEERARFYGMIANIDENFGGLRARLAELGLEEDTLLIFSTDNGSAGGVTVDEDGHLVDGYNAGMRGMKVWQYEGGHRVPFFLRWPAGGLAGGRDIDQLSSHVDVKATLLDLCGVVDEAGPPVHGRSLRPLLEGDDRDWPERSIVTDSQRLVRPRKWRHSAVMNGPWRLIDGQELYNLASDPGQRENIAAQHPQRVAQLRADYEQWWTLVSEQFERDIPMAIGGPNAQQTLLTGHDWRNEDCDAIVSQGHVRRGHDAEGYFEVEILEGGRYEFELRRWPPETQHAIDAGIEGDDVPWEREWVEKRFYFWYTGGVALPLTKATLGIDYADGRTPLDLAGEVEAGSRSARFTAELAPGAAHLRARLLDDEDHARGAYYVQVRLLEAAEA
ncbi:MAG: arylsulfatase [Anaerolineae bacterium]|nr:arylsulfatase [Anaerolineae bacterium]